jgi:23S rRNA (adenine2030-N6)-methyltransferase
MNYRHIYHAGNFADVVKHATLALIIEHLKLKPAPFRVIDTHAGIGRYELSAEEAQKTGEWRDGIGRILAAPLPAAIAGLLAPYLEAVAAENTDKTADQPLATYPGSPLIARHLMCDDDQMVVNELHPEDHDQLDMLFSRDPQTRVMAIDGWSALKAVLPPKERRGVVLIDPPFEEPGELARLLQGLAEAHRRFATGTFMLWYPIKDLRPIHAFRREATELGLEKLLCVELLIDAARGTGLAGCGLLILNPPFTLKANLDVLLPFLVDRLGQGTGATHDVRWLAPERVRSVRA